MNDDYPSVPYAGATSNELSTKLEHAPPVRKILEIKIQKLKKQLEEHEQALELLNENKNTEQLLDAFRKVGI